MVPETAILEAAALVVVSEVLSKALSKEWLAELRMVQSVSPLAVSDLL